MPVMTTDYLGVIAAMRPGSVYSVEDVPWEEYEQLLEELGEGCAVRIFYDRGRMEIMAPAFNHERPVKIMATLVGEIRRELDLVIESAGATTLKEQMKDAGAEPDESFYVQQAALIIGKEDLDLAHDPPPDLVIESDRTSSSLDKFPIYAALGVPEIWRIRKKQLHVQVLNADHYESLAVSRAFPFLSADTLNEFLALGLREGESAAARVFRDWLREHRPAAS